MYAAASQLIPIPTPGSVATQAMPNPTRPVTTTGSLETKTWWLTGIGSGASLGDFGRLTQRQSATFTRWKSKVQSLQRPLRKAADPNGSAAFQFRYAEEFPPLSPPRSPLRSPLGGFSVPPRPAK